MSKNITAWERVKMCNETKGQHLSKRTDHCLSDTLEIWLTSLCQQLSLWTWGQIGCPKHPQDTILIFFNKSLERPLPDTSLPPPSIEGPQTESCLLPKKQLLTARGRLPAARYHYSPSCIHSHFKPLFPTGVLPSTPSKTQRHQSAAADWNQKWYLNHLFKNVRPLTH